LIGGGLTSPITVPIRVDANNRVSVVGSAKATVTINSSTALFRGSVVDPRNGKPLQFQGAIFDDWDVGLGYFLNPAQSGQVLITPAP